MALKGQMINEGERATINYTLSDCGDHYTITPRCYFDTKGTKAKVKLDRDTGRLMIKPRVTPKAVKENERCGVSQAVGCDFPSCVGVSLLGSCLCCVELNVVCCACSCR